MGSVHGHDKEAVRRIAEDGDLELCPWVDTLQLRQRGGEPVMGYFLILQIKLLVRIDGENLQVVSRGQRGLHGSRRAPAVVV